MTPDKRLNQIEPIMADVLQKVDRLVEGQGQLVEFAVDTKAELEEVKATLNEQVLPLLNEHVVPTLNTLTHQMNEHVVPTLNTLTQQMNGHVVPTLDQVKTAGEITATGLAKLTLTVSDLRDEMRERFDRSEQTGQEMRERFDRSEQTQQEILTILRSQIK